jgi:hypothetical protein
MDDYFIVAGFQVDGLLHQWAGHPPLPLSREEIAAIPPVKARDERIAKLETTIRHLLGVHNYCLCDGCQNARTALEFTE